MFDIGFSELLLAACIGLVVIGPERLPAMARKLGQWTGESKRMVARMKQQIEDEVGLEDIQQQLQESSVVEEIKSANISFTEVTAPDSSKSDPAYWPGKPPPGA